MTSCLNKKFQSKKLYCVMNDYDVALRLERYER